MPCIVQCKLCRFVLCDIQLENVIGFCCDFLFSWLDESNILEVHHLADLYELQQLKAMVHSYILRNIQSLSRTDVYRQLPEEDIFRALSSDELQVTCENEAYEAALHFHYSPDEVETDQVYLQVSLKVCLHFTLIWHQAYLFISLPNALKEAGRLHLSQDNLRMLDAVRFCLIEKQTLQRLHSRLKECPLKDSVSVALRYHEQEMWQPILQSPLTQPRSTFHCILGFGGMFSSSSLADNKQLFHAFHPSWRQWKTLTAAHKSQMSNQGIAVLNNFVYLIGGDMNKNGFRAENCCWR